jgi:hypothetical protein
MSRRGRFHDRHFIAEMRRREIRTVAEFAAQWMPDMAAEARNEGWELVRAGFPDEQHFIRAIPPGHDEEMETLVLRRANEGSGMHKIAAGMCGWR